MSMLRYALPALAALRAASAQNSCSVSGTTTIQNSGDASAIASCTTFTGNIAIATGTADGISFDGNLNRIKNGGLSCQNAPNITSISGDSLQTIDGTFNLDNVQILQTLSFAQLSSVGSVVWNALPNLASLDMTTEIQDTDELNIQNTFLSALTGINLKECNSFYLANNRMLQEVALQLQNVSGAITLESNGDRLTVTFPNLESAENITFRNVPSVSMPSLNLVNGSLAFVENEGLQNISCPNLTRVDGSLSVNTNPDLTSFSFPEVTKVGGAVNVQNNTKIKTISFPKLQQVTGAFDAYGNFSNITLPAIKGVAGAFNVQSSEDISKDCSTFEGESGPNSVLRGDYKCAGSQTNPGDASSSPSGTSSSGSGSGNTGAASSLNMPTTAMTGVLGVLAAMLGML